MKRRRPAEVKAQRARRAELLAPIARAAAAMRGMVDDEVPDPIPFAPPSAAVLPAVEPVVVRTSTTARAAGTANRRMLPLLSPTMLAWARSQPSVLDAAAPPGGCDPQHWPPRGRGVRVDLLVIPLTREQHDRAQRYAGGLDEDEQDRLLGRTMRALFTRADNRETALRVLDELSASGRGEDVLTEPTSPTR